MWQISRDFYSNRVNRNEKSTWQFCQNIGIVWQDKRFIPKDLFLQMKSYDGKIFRAIIEINDKFQAVKTLFSK